MPELPEVETVVRALRKPLTGRTIVDVESFWGRQIVMPDLPTLKEKIPNSSIAGINRRGKYILIELDTPYTLLVHLKMTGHLAVDDSHSPRHKHVRTIFVLDNGQELRFRDVRKFGRIYFVKDLDRVLGKLGPEPLAETFTVSLLKERLQGRSGVLKSLLLDQTFVAGVGNIYADEALFDAGIHPLRRANTLTGDEITRLHAGIQKVLRLGIEREGASIDSYVKPDGQKGDMQNAVMVFRRTGQPCYDCQTSVTRIKVGGRSTHFCVKCQQ